MEALPYLVTIASVLGIGATLLELLPARRVPCATASRPAPARERREPGEVLGDGALRWRLR